MTQPKGTAAPAWLLSRLEDLIRTATCDERRKTFYEARLSGIRFVGEAEALKYELEQQQPSRPFSQTPHPQDELARRLSRDRDD